MLPDWNCPSIWTGQLEPAIGLKARNAWSVARAVGFPNAGYEPHPSCADSARSRPKRAAKISRKIVAGQQWLRRIVETLAELPFIGDQVVCLSHDQAARSGPAESIWETPVPHHVILDCKIAARLFGRCPQRVKSRIMPDSLCSSLRRPHNHQLRTAIVSANWRGCEGGAAPVQKCCAEMMSVFGAGDPEKSLSDNRSCADWGKR